MNAELKQQHLSRQISSFAKAAVKSINQLLPPRLNCKMQISRVDKLQMERVYCVPKNSTILFFAD